MRLVDTNNTFRAFSEACSSGMALREYFELAYHDPNPTIYLFDGQNALVRRRAIFPGYKVGRQKASDNFYLHLTMLQELLVHSGKIVLRVPLWEADDVIAHLTKCLDGPIEIDSTDKDFLALVSDRVKVPKAKMEAVPACDIPLYKTLVGDTSDKIPGIVRFGDKSWAELTEDHKSLWSECLRGTEDMDPAALGLRKPGHIKACDFKLLRSYWQVVGFFPMEDGDIMKHMIHGKKNYDEANKFLKGILQ